MSGYSSETAARSIGQCGRCGGGFYAGVTHFCGTLRYSFAQGLSGYGIGYGTQAATRRCPTCDGTGINPVWISKVCPKCDGEKTIRR